MSSKEKSLRAELSAQIDHFEEQSDKHKRIYRNLRYLVFGLIGSSTVLASAAMSCQAFQGCLNLLVVLTTAMAGVATSIEGLRKPSELWIHEKSIFYDLKDLKREMDFEASESGSLQEVDKYFLRFQQILTSSKSEWAKTVKSAGAGKP